MDVKTRTHPAAEPDLADLSSWLHPADESLATRLGIDLTAVSAERVTGRMPVAGNRQLHGLLHGGATAAFAETLGSIGAAVHAGPGRMAVGVDLNATHHRAIRHGRVTGVATALHLGDTSAGYEIVVTDEDDQRVCTARLTCAIQSRRGSRLGTVEGRP
jgi:1,4-dihydroxy-2-naphthoyl-CoA hydrolase